ncbi:DNA-binding protein, partial [Leifsonia sp. SIMBA_070]
IALLAMGGLYLMMFTIRSHYDSVARELSVEDDHQGLALPSRVNAVILVSKVHKPALRALAYARASRPSSLNAIIVDIDPEDT